MSAGCCLRWLQLWPLLMAWFALAPQGLAQDPPPSTTPPTATLPPMPEPPPVQDLKTRIQLDTDKLIFSYVRDDAPVQSEKENQQEFDAYNAVLIHARQFSLNQLYQHARADLTFADFLKKTRRDFQFKLVLVQGRLKRLRNIEPNKPLKDAGINELYEGWIFPRESGIHMHDPICILLTELPPGLTPQLDYQPAVEVRFPGYFFKVMQYESQAPTVNNPSRGQMRRAPLLMGRSLIVDAIPTNDASGPWRWGLIPGILGLFAIIVAFTLGLSWYYRRGDRLHQKTIEERRSRNPFASPSQDTEPPITSQN